MEEIMGKINKLCGCIEKVIDEMIPEKWESFYFNGEMDDNAGIGSVYFFYNTENKKNEYVYSLDTPENYSGISEDELNIKEEELFEIVCKIKRIFVDNEIGEWNNFILIVNSERQAELKFDYADWNNSQFSDVDRIEYFKYKYIGILGEDRKQEELFREMEEYQKRFNKN